MRKTGGLMTEEDLAGHQAKVVKPLVLPYRDVELVLLPYQAGGITIGEALNILNGFDLGANGLSTATTLHLIARRAGEASPTARLCRRSRLRRHRLGPAGLGRVRGRAANGDRSHAGLGARNRAPVSPARRPISRRSAPMKAARPTSRSWTVRARWSR